MATRIQTPHAKLRARCFRVCEAFNMGRGDRLAFASTFLDRNVDSFLDLDINELSRLRDALEGAALVCALQMERQGKRVALV